MPCFVFFSNPFPKRDISLLPDLCCAGRTCDDLWKKWPPSDSEPPHAVPTAASQAADLTRARYDSGTVGYLEFLDAERTRLQTEHQANQATAQRFIATVRLVKAMGGGW